jgi:acetyl esterase/lipase
MFSFPAALEWTFANKAKLGISKIICSGVSGGGNLSLATTMKAKKEGKVDMVQGVYAQCPYIAGPEHYEKRSFTSMVENDGYLLNIGMMSVFAQAYAPDNHTNPLAWPTYSTVDDLKGLPPHCISINQLDPLRDEALAHYVKLLKAGVKTCSRTVNGTTHAGDCMFGNACPDIFEATIGDIKRFADGV